MFLLSAGIVESKSISVCLVFYWLLFFFSFFQLIHLLCSNEERWVLSCFSPPHQMNLLQVDSIQHMQLLGEHSQFPFLLSLSQPQFKIENGNFHFVVVILCAVLTIERPLNSEG